MEIKSGIPLSVAMAMVMGASWAEGAVVGGVSIDIKEAPYQIHLTAGSSGCGGTWIGGRWIVTAGHCVEGESASQSFVSVGITRDRDMSKSQIPVKRIISHPDYPSTGEKDIALLELAQDITSVVAKPVPYATPADTLAGLTAVGKAGRLTGWGALSQAANRWPDSLQKLDAKIAGGRASNKWQIFFAGAQGSTLQGSCFGDSGGPLVVKDAAGTGWILAGVVSSGSSVCGDAEPDSYTRLSMFSDWIKTSTGGVTAVPNPAQNALPPFWQGNAIWLEKPEVLDISVANVAGTLVRHTRRAYPAGEHALSLAGLPAGIYYANVKGKGIGILRQN